MADRIIPVETLTGKRILPWIKTGDFSWKSSLTEPGAGVFPIRVRDSKRKLTPKVVDLLSRGWGTTYVVETGPDSPRPGRIKYAGPVVSSSWDSTSGTLTVNTKELPELLKRRTFWTQDEIRDVPSRTFRGGGMDGWIRDIFAYSMTRSALGADRVPIILPHAESGTLAKTVFRYNFPTAQQVLDEIAAEGGPDWYLKPEWSGDVLVWRLIIGAPNIPGGQLRFMVPTPETPVKSPVTGFRVDESFHDQWTHIAAIGAGGEEDMRWSSYQAIPPAGVPNMFHADSHKHLDATTALWHVAREAAQRSNRGITQLSYGLQFQPSDRVSADMIEIGTRLFLDHPGDQVIRPKRFHEYVMAVSGDQSSGKVNVESQAV